MFQDRNLLAADWVRRQYLWVGDGFEFAGRFVDGAQQATVAFHVAPAGDGTLAKLHAVLRQRARLVRQQDLHLQKNLVSTGSHSKLDRLEGLTCPSSSLRSDELQTAGSSASGQ